MTLRGDGLRPQFSVMDGAKGERRKASPNVVSKVAPLGICIFDKTQFPGAIPPFDLFFSPNG
jgi:hypothetical protein